MFDCCPFYGGGSVVVGLLFVVAPIVGVCDCSMFCCTLLYVPSGFAVVLVGRRGVVAALLLVVLCGSSLRCHGFVCNL